MTEKITIQHGSMAHLWHFGRYVYSFQKSEPLFSTIKFWARKDLNLRPPVYETDALTN